MLEYFINGEWMSWERAHDQYGYTRTPTSEIGAFTADLQPFVVRYDSGEQLYWSASWGRWYDSLEGTGLYFSSSDIPLYKGSSEEAIFNGYSNTFQGDTTAIEMDGVIVDLADAYLANGLTRYPCVDWIVLGGVVVAWYDSENGLYWDDREGAKAWTQVPPEVTGGDDFFGIFKCTLQMIDIDIGSMTLDP